MYYVSYLKYILYSQDERTTVAGRRRRVGAHLRIKKDLEKFSTLFILNR